MAAIIKTTSMLLVAAVVFMAVSPPTEAAIGCGTVVSYLNPCIPYVTNRGPIGKCCGGVEDLYGAAKTTADRRSVCTCLKSVAGSFTGLNYGKVAGLPGLCRLNIPYKISPSTDCSKVQ